MKAIITGLIVSMGSWASAAQIQGRVPAEELTNLFVKKANCVIAHKTCDVTLEEYPPFPSPIPINPMPGPDPIVIVNPINPEPPTPPRGKAYVFSFNTTDATDMGVYQSLLAARGRGGVSKLQMSASGELQQVEIVNGWYSNVVLSNGASTNVVPGPTPLNPKPYRR